MLLISGDLINKLNEFAMFIKYKNVETIVSITFDIKTNGNNKVDKIYKVEIIGLNTIE